MALIRGGIAPVASVRDLHVRFGATHAVNGVSLDFYEGEVLGLVGTNGAGKSTLIKALSGVHQPASGAIEIDGRPVRLPDPLAASRAGIETVHQNIDQGVVPGMTVAENLALDSLADGSVPVWASPKRIEAEARAIAQSFEFDVDLHRPVEDLPASQRQQLIIARAVHRRARLLILDEPTSTLSAAEVGLLFDVVRRLAAAHVAVIYISHDLAEIEDLCDRVAVLRDGRLAWIYPRPVSRAQLVEAMLGEMITDLRPEPVEGGDVVLELDGVVTAPGGPSVRLAVRRGEVLGITGLVGSGKSELLRQVFGVDPLLAGTMRLRGRPYVPSDPHDAVAAGVGYVPEEHGVQATIPQWTVAQNVTLPYLARYATVAGFVRRRREADAAEQLVARLHIRCRGTDAPIESLSGGNQQKVIVARWLQGDADLLILDEPFRGIDVGARRDIARELRETARDRAVIVASSDPEEILEVADRIIVLAGGSIAGEIAAGGATTKQIAQLMSGVAA